MCKLSIKTLFLAMFPKSKPFQKKKKKTQALWTLSGKLCKGVEIGSYPIITFEAPGM